MTRRLNFDGDKRARRFLTLREAFVTGGIVLGQANAPKPRAVIRSEARILDAMDVVSVAPAQQKPMPGGVEYRELTPTATELLILQEDYALIEKHFDALSWSTPEARPIIDMLDWFSAADKVERDGG